MLKCWSPCIFIDSFWTSQGKLFDSCQLRKYWNPIKLSWRVRLSGKSETKRSNIKAIQLFNYKNAPLERSREGCLQLIIFTLRNYFIHLR